MHKKILVLGASSFVARSIAEEYSETRDSFPNLELKPVDRDVCDISDINQLRECLERELPHTVIHCGMSGEGRLLKPDTAQNFYENVLMQENLLALSHTYKKLILFGSGAEWDREKDIINSHEETPQIPFPNFYSLAKQVNHQRAKGNPKVIYLRIFNVFGHLEKSNRFIKASILKTLESKPIEIWGNTLFDFFYAGDLARLIFHTVSLDTSEYNEYEEINTVYQNKFKFSEIADLINQCSEKPTEIKVDFEGVNRHYTGDGSRLSMVSYGEIGLAEGIKKTYQKLKNG